MRASTCYIKIIPPRPRFTTSVSTRPLSWKHVSSSSLESSMEIQQGHLIIQNRQRPINHVCLGVHPTVSNKLYKCFFLGVHRGLKWNPCVCVSIRSKLLSEIYAVLHYVKPTRLLVDRTVFQNVLSELDKKRQFNDSVKRSEEAVSD